MEKKKDYNDKLILKGDTEKEVTQDGYPLYPAKEDIYNKSLKTYQN